MPKLTKNLVTGVKISAAKTGVSYPNRKRPEPFTAEHREALSRNSHWRRKVQ